MLYSLAILPPSPGLKAGALVASVICGDNYHSGHDVHGVHDVHDVHDVHGVHDVHEDRVQV